MKNMIDLEKWITCLHNLLIKVLILLAITSAALVALIVMGVR